MTKRLLVSRGRWQFFHDWMSTSGGLYPAEGKYRQLTIQVFHWEGLAASLDIMAPLIGDVRISFNNKRSREYWDNYSYMRHKTATRRVSFERRSIREIKEIEQLNRERNDTA